MAECNADLHLNMEDSKWLLKSFRKHPFEIPKSLIVFNLRATIDILDAKEDRKEVRTKYNLEYLDNIFCHYAALMVSMADEITPKVKETILDCLNICYTYVSESLSVPFEISENVMGFIDNPSEADT